MDSEGPLFASIWQQRQEAEPEPPSNQCSHAQQFAAWTEEICRDALRKRDLVSINQAKVLLVDRYFEWRTFVPKSHRNRMAENGHMCIFHVFEEVYRRLKLLELSLTPPMLFLPPPPPTPVAPVYKIYKVDGFPIGGAEEDEDNE